MHSELCAITHFFVNNNIFFIKFVLPKNKRRMKKTIYSWLMILLGCAITAIGFVFFINPYGLVPGGVYGASIVLQHLFPSIQVGTFGYMLDIPLLTLSVLLLGAKIGSRTIVAALTTPFIMNALEWIAYPSTEALQALDPAQLLGGILDLSNHLIIAAVIGASIIGLGCGMIVRQQATSGGSDIVAMILQKYCHLRFSRAILLVDGTVVLFGLIVIGFGIGSGDAASSGQPTIYLSLYSLAAIFVTSRVLAFVINGPKNDKLMFVISEKHLPDLREYIIKDLDRTATYIKSSGLYTGHDKEMLFLVVSYKEVENLKLKIKQADPAAFVVVTDAYDTYGEGWKPLPSSKNDLNPE